MVIFEYLNLEKRLTKLVFLHTLVGNREMRRTERVSISQEHREEWSAAESYSGNWIEKCVRELIR